MNHTYLVQHFLEHSTARVPDKVALICDDRRLTYGDINTSADRLAAVLIRMGVKRQDRVAIFLDNSAESVISLFGILKAGAIFIMLSPTMKSKKLNTILLNKRHNTNPQLNTTTIIVNPIYKIDLNLPNQN